MSAIEVTANELLLYEQKSIMRITASTTVRVSDQTDMIIHQLCGIKEITSIRLNVYDTGETFGVHASFTLGCQFIRY